jgi:hypothetical protein
MYRKILTFALALLGAGAARPADLGHRFQLIAVDPGRTQFGFVDATSLNRSANGVSYWWLVIYQPAAVTRDASPVVYQMRQRSADCAGRRTRDTVVMAHYENGDERWISLISRYRSIRPGSVGDSELRFACDGVLPDKGLPVFDSIEAARTFAAATRSVLPAADGPPQPLQAGDH